MAAEVSTGTSVPEGVGPGKVFPPLDPGTFAPQLFWLAISFGLLYWLLKRFALPKVAAVIDERRRHIELDLDTAEKLKVQTQLALSRYELALSEAHVEANGIAKDLRDKFAAEAEAARAKHDALVSQKLAEAEHRIAQKQGRGHGRLGRNGR